MTRSNEILCRPQGHSWNSPHSHDGDLSGALYLSCPGEPCVITLLDPRVAAVAGPEELLGSGTPYNSNWNMLARPMTRIFTLSKLIWTPPKKN